ncbi:MAG: HupE/UreJ family protein [Woeseiaceae bacterium]|nr:HupE/UreJ family protein [Woeseiaceae bacterium]
MIFRVLPLILAVIKLTLFFALVLAPREPALAHEVPTEVMIQTMIKPEANELDFLVRVPLDAMRDILFPQTGPGYLVISASDELLNDAATIWIAQEVTLYENDEPLTEWEIVATRLALPSDRSFDGYDTALATVMSPPLDDSEELHRDQALLDILIRYPIHSAASEFAIAPEFARLGLQTTTIVRYLHVDGAERLYHFSGDPGLLKLNPRWHHAFVRFVRSGIDHILDGIDHLLFVICLLIPFRKIRPLVVIVTAFTAAHSITLIASVFGIMPNFLWFPPLIETIIAASIVYMAFENIVGGQWEKRWIIAFAFGLVHGFGFSFALSEIMQFAGGHLVTSLLAFNIGVEIGQLMIIVLAVPIINFLFRHVVAERMGTILLSAMLAHSGWHWMSDRASELGQYSFQWPVMNASFFAAVIRWVMLLVIVCAILWGLVQLYGRFLRDDSAPELSQSTDSG